MYKTRLTLTTVSEYLSPSIFQVFQLQSKISMRQIYLTFVQFYLLFILPRLLFVKQLAPSAVRCVARESSSTTKDLNACFSSLPTSPLLHHYVKWQNGILTQMYQGLFLQPGTSDLHRTIGEVAHLTLKFPFSCGGALAEYQRVTDRRIAALVWPAARALWGRNG